MKVWINEKFFDIEKARISIFDRGLLYGDGVFETMRSYAGVVFKLEEHLDRLFNDLKIIKIKSPYTKRHLSKVIYKCLDVNRLKSGYMRLAITRGEGRFGIGYKDTLIPNVIMVAKEFEEYPDWMYRRGISVKISKIRQNDLSPLSNIKSLNFLNYILARLYAKDDGYDEAILVNTKGYIAEGATSNIFLVKSDSLATPALDSGILPGITRRVIIGIAKRLRIKISQKRVTCRELLNADEVFFTNSLAEVLPVTKVDGRLVGCGLPGEATKLFHISYQKQVIRETLF